MRILAIILLLTMSISAFAGKHKQQKYKAKKEHQSSQYSRKPGRPQKRHWLHL